MPCFHPLTGHRAYGGGISFNPKTGYVDQPMQVPCGRCIGCKLERSRQWAVRLLHERQLHDASCFITLTYDDKYLPSGGTLVKGHFQSFMKRLRKHVSPVPLRFFHCGEYGENLSRPHYHAILYGFDFPDKTRWSGSEGNMLYRSPSLDRIWGMGFCSIGPVTFESASYVAAYCVKKITGDQAKAHYGLRLPEYVTMSRRPGIAADWFKKYASDVYPSDSVVARGHPSKPPRYYDKAHSKSDPKSFELLKRERLLSAITPEAQADATVVRLRDRETVTSAKFNLRKRNLNA